mgnify:FL=1
MIQPPLLDERDKVNRSELFHGPTSKNGFLSRIIGSAFLLLAITASVATAKDVSGYIDDVDVSGRLIIVDGEPYAARTSATLLGENGRPVTLSELHYQFRSTGASSEVSLVCEMTTRRSPTGGPDEILQLKVDFEEF